MANFEDVFKGIKTLYLEETRQRAAAMSRLVGDLERQARRDAQAEQALDALVVQFHGLAGTGTSYGFEELSLLGRMGEIDAGTRQRLGGELSSEDLKTWRALISQIEAAATPVYLSGGLQ